MILEIVKYPDNRLKHKSTEIENFDDELHSFLDDMRETMIARNGIGLAGVQVGILKRVFIINIPNEENEYSDENLLEVINPKIVEKYGNTSYEEGCLSIPEYFETVQRAEKIDVSFFDRHGNEQRKRLSGLHAIAFQHEFDHLNGRVFVERISYMKKRKFEKEWKKRIRE
ncbi:peptide deformylase [Thiovulum sp. ES]|nr:peptide deformylase [Thiovulum sp. ES]